MLIYQRVHVLNIIIANLRYPAKKNICWLVDIPINTKRLKD